MQDQDLKDTLLKKYGPLMGGEDLRRALGYRTWSAFARAARLDGLGVKVFELPGRRGKFALTIDVATWLVAMRSSQPETQPEENIS